ncbi:unnamed protein product [Rotaria magnacalcarata]|uniref:Uncharacterized protein n=1 Tax=Rotaria magnacalcarata TaxID=392030 RepID=A0A814R6R7_9BILA|nr:unnamed protein product [Rotaria magnacalcarata]CAF1628997.1 unnamed protein product [Rotaria magnacalcarata]CAF1942933.1 unnamed protein product [Rotaria magnacalcarata]CAF1977227.1 unnamed protein product [Rotaria magnacalcarata]CAF2050513.1 unnamed protein product [Rotaria magnacalcarata]
MIYRSFFICVVLIGLSIVIARNDVKFRNLHQNRFARNNDHSRSLRNLVGKLVDTDTNTIYSVDGHRQQDIPRNSGTTTVASVAPISPPSYEQIACLSACQQCVEENQKIKKADDNCGPMCDCADSCFLMSAVEVGKLYGQNTNSEYGRECWWRVYTEMLNNDMLSTL